MLQMLKWNEGRLNKHHETSRFDSLVPSELETIGRETPAIPG